MTTVLNQTEIEQILHSIFCNGALGFAMQSGIDYEYDEADYKLSKAEGDCYEDVLLKMLKDGGKISFIDIENDGEFSKDLTMALATERFTNITENELLGCVQMILNGHGDAETDYSALQYILYGRLEFC